MCIAAKVTCEATTSKCPVENISLPPILEYRLWMAYSLYANSATSNALIHEANIATIHKVGIPIIPNMGIRQYLQVQLCATSN